MSNKARDTLDHGLSFLAIVIGIWIAVHTIGFVSSAIGGWHNDIVQSAEMSPEERAEYEKRLEEWKNDPANPEYQKRKCVKDGGYPEEHWWKGGDITCEKAKL